MKPRGSPYAVSAIAAALTLAHAGTARSDTRPGPRTSSFAWVREPGAERCIDARTLAQAVERRLGRAAIVAPTSGDIAIEGRVEKRESPNAWHATITVSDGSGARIGMRELVSDEDDCHALDEELGLVVSLLIDPEAALAPARPVVAIPPLPAPPPLCPPPPAAAPVPSKPWRIAAEGGIVIGLGVLPAQPATGVLFRARATPPVGPSFELGGSVWIDNHVDVGGATATFSLAFGSASICPLDLSAAGNVISACAGARVGSLRVGDVPTRYRQESLIVDVTAEARVRRRLVGPLLAGLGVGIAVPTRRDRFFFVDGDGTRQDVFRASPVAGTFDISIGLEIP